MNTPETNKLLEDLSRVNEMSDDALQTELRIFCRAKWNAAIDDRDNAILEAKKLREQNAKLRTELDQLKEGAK